MLDWLVISASVAGACSLLVIVAVAVRVTRRAKQQRARTAAQPRADSYLAVPAATLEQSHVTNCYSTEYVQCPHKQQASLERTATIPFELPVPLLASSISLNSVENGNGLLNAPGHTPDTELSPTPSSSSYCLGAIDPELYQLDDDAHMMYDVPDQHLGRLWFSVQYRADTERLLVTVLRARNLTVAAGLGGQNACDSYVRLEVLPEKRRVLQTKVKKRTVIPNYDESFVFQIPNKDLERRFLRLTVYHVTKHRKHVAIGHAQYPLREQIADEDDRCVIWRDLEDVEEVSGERGELSVSLCYNSQLERLTVGVYQAKDWAPDAKEADYYCKVSLLQQSRILKTKRTDVIRRTREPTFNESFTFKLAGTQIDTASVSAQAMQRFLGHKDKCLGRITLGPFMFARGKELAHWNEMLANPKEHVAYSHKLC